MGKEEKRMALSSKIASSKLTQNQLFLLKAQIVFFIAVAISMLIVLVNSFQMKYQGKHRKKVRP